MTKEIRVTKVTKENKEIKGKMENRHVFLLMAFGKFGMQNLENIKRQNMKQLLTSM